MADNQDLSYIGYSHLVDPYELDVFQVIRAALSEPLSDLACDWINQAQEDAKKLLSA